LSKNQDAKRRTSTQVSVVQKVLASKKKNLKAQSNVQLKQKTVAKGNPNHRKMAKAMKPLKNKINDV
jgi:hypothetical protein